jgi:hypothetical protein
MKAPLLAILIFQISTIAIAELPVSSAAIVLPNGNIRVNHQRYVNTLPTMGIHTYYYMSLNNTVDQNSNFKTNFSFDKIDRLDWTFSGNQSNYSYSIFCYYNTNISVTVFSFTCPNVCHSYMIYDEFINYCEVYVWHDDAFEGRMNTTLLLDVNITITYEGNAEPNPFDPAPEPVPVPTSEPPADTPEPTTLSVGAVVGIAVGSALGVAALVTAGVFGVRKYLSSQQPARE